MLKSVLRSIFVAITGLFILLVLFVLGVGISKDVTLAICIFLAYFMARYLVFVWNFWKRRWWSIRAMIICIFLLILLMTILECSLAQLTTIYQGYLAGFMMLFLFLRFMFFFFFRLIPFAINYRKTHPYKPLFSKEEWQFIVFVCLYKILTGKRR